MENQGTRWDKVNNDEAMLSTEQAQSLQPDQLFKFFQGRRVAICSMHGKEQVMRPLIKKYLGLDTETGLAINTDEFGTFSGEVERIDDPITTLRKKILKGLATSGLTLGIGNEGSFGSHPKMPFIPCDQEIVMLIDLENNIEIFDGTIAAETNHDQKTISSVTDLIEFATRAAFPRHGLILKQVEGGLIKRIQKGILDWERLYDTMADFDNGTAAIIAETDMRAHVNPTRMKIIEQATENLMKKLVNTCPECQWPGFACTETKSGLPCSSCGEETRLTLSMTYRCKNCDYTDERFYTQGPNADPQYCDHCNP